jgi:hypothetical protein
MAPISSHPLKGERIEAMESNLTLHWLALALLAATVSYWLKRYAK